MTIVVPAVLYQRLKTTKCIMDTGYDNDDGFITLDGRQTDRFLSGKMFAQYALQLKHVCVSHSIVTVVS